MTNEVKRLLACAAEQPPEPATALPFSPVAEPPPKAPRLRHLVISDPIAACRMSWQYLLQATLKLGYRKVYEGEIQRMRMPETPRASHARAAASQPSQREPSAQTTPVEAVLEDYGYSSLADSVRRRRKTAESSVAGKMYR